MGMFSKMSEDEIQKRQVEQDARQRELDRLALDLEHRAKIVTEAELRLAGEWDELTAGQKSRAEEFAEKTRTLRAAELALDLREAEAKAGFVEEQRAVFRTSVEARVGQLDARQRELDEAEERRMSAVEVRETSCAERERRLHDSEGLSRERHALLAKQDAELHRRQQEVAQAEKERDEGYTETRRKLDDECSTRQQELARQAEALREREARIRQAEIKRDAGFSEERSQLESALHQRARQAAAELDTLRAQRLSELQSELDAERHKRREELAYGLEAERAQANTQLAARRKELKEECERANTQLRTAHESANTRLAELTAKEREVDLREKQIATRDAALTKRQQTLDNEVKEAVAHRQKELDAEEARLAERKAALDELVDQEVVDRRASFERKEESQRAELIRVRSQLQSADRLLGQFESLKRQLGGREAELVLVELEAKKSELVDLKEQLAQGVPAVREESERLRGERDSLQASMASQTQELLDLRGRLRGEDVLRLELVEAKDQAKRMTDQRDLIDGHCNQLMEENKRLRSAYEREQDREARIRDIETPELSDLPRRGEEEKIDELEWLDSIGKRCTEYGLRFHPRILRAFHTSLKTAEWSPLTVLAGVSGTGKSELPRLYSHFGGMMFKSLPVQPNWDSQESMLGFFNSIDNKFDAQPLLRLLVRSQQSWTEKNHGLKDFMVMVLLDEMNLAHAELYFAEFLSKLELRRGTRNKDVPSLEVKLGAGLLPYAVTMGRNVLWAGTMNQDETTKALSDKVLDRSIVIHFPQPANLERRRVLAPLPPQAGLLPRRIWESWWTKKSDFSDEEIRPFKAVIEDINRAMSKVGRALGHRVWQSVEYYMANYPDTLAAQRNQDQDGLHRAMRTAFEDQLVQKVMPKLRGIDTRGRGKTDCLDKVRAVLADNKYEILDDFDLSCECGYGQFIWQTVSFLQERNAEGQVPEVRTKADAPAQPSGESAAAAADAGPEQNGAESPEKAAKPRRRSEKKREKDQAPDEGDAQ